MVTEVANFRTSPPPRESIGCSAWGEGADVGPAVSLPSELQIQARGLDVSSDRVEVTGLIFLMLSGTGGGHG